MSTALVDERGSTRSADDATRLLRRVTLLAAGFAVLGVLYVIANRSVGLVLGSRASDLDINLVAARRLVEGHDLYDGAASRLEGMRHVTSHLRTAYHDTFTSFIGAPLVAALHVPFTGLGHSTAVALFRLVDLVTVVGAAFLTVRAVPRYSRLPANFVAVGALALSYPLVRTLEVGQFHGLVMVGLALGVWGVATDRIGIAGVGLGLAAALKLSPVLLLVYLAARGRRQVVLPAALTFVALSAGTALMGRPSAIVTWIGDVVPKISGGTSYIGNQSVPAWIDRMVMRSDDVLAQAPLGATRMLGPLLALAGCGLLWACCRRRLAVAPLELGGVIVVMLLAGPLTWDHYYVWAIIPVVLLADVEAWLGLSSRFRVAGVALLGVAITAWSLPPEYSSPAALARDWNVRVSGSPYPVAGILVFVLIVMLLHGHSGLKRPGLQAVVSA